MARASRRGLQSEGCGGKQLLLHWCWEGTRGRRDISCAALLTPIVKSAGVASTAAGAVLTRPPSFFCQLQVEVAKRQRNL